MSPLKSREQEELRQSLNELSDFFKKRGLEFEGQSREKGFNVSEFATKKILLELSKKAKAKLMPIEFNAMVEVFLGRKEVASLEGLRLIPEFRRICFEIARHEQLIIEKGLRSRIEINNLLINRLAGLTGRMIEIYRPKTQAARLNFKTSLLRLEMERDPNLWRRIRRLEELAEEWKGKPGMKSSVAVMRKEIREMKDIAAKGRSKPLLSQTRQIARKLKPRRR